MKTLAAVILALAALVPAVTSAQATDLTGNWNATFTRTAPTGQTQSITFTFHFTQKGKELTGTIGPEPARQWKVDKGMVDGAKVTFQVQQPEGPLRSFELTHAKGRLEGLQKLEYQGQTAEVTVVAERAKSEPPSGYFQAWKIAFPCACGCPGSTGASHVYTHWARLKPAVCNIPITHAGLGPHQLVGSLFNSVPG